MHDVIIIGGGPVGSHMAQKLSEMGHSVTVLERKEVVGEGVCCTGIIGRECAQAFAVEESLILRWAKGARLFSPSGKCLEIHRRQPQACVIDRAAFDAAMAARAKGSGAKYQLGMSVSHIDIEGDRVRVDGVRRGERVSFEGRAAVIAAGSASRLVERTGLGRFGHFYAGAQVEVEADDIDEMELYFGQAVAPGFFAWLVPTLPGRALAGMLTSLRAKPYLDMLLLSLKEQGKIKSVAGEVRSGGVLLKPPSRTYGDRLLVVGGAAGQVKPTTGGGIYYGLLCAGLAADTLHKALSEDTLSARSLAAYQRAWQQKIGRELKTGRWVRRVYSHLRDGRIEKIFDIMKKRGIEQEMAKSADIAFDWHGEAMVRLLGGGAIARAMRLMKLPGSLFR